MSARPGLGRRQLWYAGQTTSGTASQPRCTPFILPSDGLVLLDDSSTVTLTTDVTFQPKCTGVGDRPYEDVESPTTITDPREPFYASTIPQTYVIAAATVLSYMLFIMLLITPRTFYVRGVSGRGFLGGRQLIRGASRRSSVVGVGGRPWLQKLAAMTVAISLSIATAETFKVAKRQYELGSMNATELREEVVSGREIRIIRVISDTILWVAQVQTLVRLFPRHREKVIIKWAGFALIVLDTVFAILNNFVYQGRSRPRKYVDAIPALSYLFALALSLLYAAWVIYYSISKRRFAFYHPKMRNMALVAMLALASVLIPIIFFVIDICKPDVAGWGDYVRWVGAAAASVVVWEWVERIEALEREERKDGVLGREIFDGDEMLDLTPSEEVSWPLRRRGNDNGGPGGGGPSDGRVHFASSGTDAAAHRPPRPPAARGRGLFRRPMWSSTTAGPQVPPTSDTPISRTDTLSAGSTVYAVHYHPISESNTPIPEHEAGDEASSGLSGGWKTPDDVQRTNRSRSDV